MRDRIWSNRAMPDEQEKRLVSFYPQYFDIMHRQLRDAQKYGRLSKAALPDYSTLSVADQLKCIGNLLRGLESLNIARVFAGMTVEAYINHLAYEKLTAFYREHLDKLSMVMKWVTIPKLVYGKGFEPGTQVVEGLDRIGRRRNELVHFKPGKQTPIPSDVMLIELEGSHFIADDVHRAVAALYGIDPEFEEEFVRRHSHQLGVKVVPTGSPAENF